MNGLESGSRDKPSNRLMAKQRLVLCIPVFTRYVCVLKIANNRYLSIRSYGRIAQLLSALLVIKHCECSIQLSYSEWFI